MTGGLERTGRGPYYAQGGAGSIASPHLGIARQLDRAEKLDLLPPFHAEELTDPNDPRLLEVFAILSDPDNASHLVEQTHEIADIQDRMNQEHRHVVAVMNEEGAVVATATIDDSHQIEDERRIIAITSHHINLFAVRTDLQSKEDGFDGRSRKRTGSRSFEAVLKYFFEDSKTYYGKQRVSGYWKINMDVQGAGRMDRIARRLGAKVDYIRAGILEVTDKMTGTIFTQRGMKYYLSLFDYVENRLDNASETLRIETSPIPEDVIEYYTGNVHAYRAAVRREGISPL